MVLTGLGQTDLEAVSERKPCTLNPEQGCWPNSYGGHLNEGIATGMD